MDENDGGVGGGGRKRKKQEMAATDRNAFCVMEGVNGSCRLGSCFKSTLPYYILFNHELYNNTQVEERYNHEDDYMGAVV
mmetsp:Transcript_950/g.1551  ORF Transcript_950/g.1551 Transcript_950/m.1551 type:complete len:80 (-) Transcript_950:158-397(-)